MFNPFKKFLSYPILVGNALVDFTSMATNTILVSFILSKGMGIYQTQNTLILIMGVIIAIAIQKKPMLMKISYNNFKTFLIIEGVAQAVIGIATLITGTPYIYVVASIIKTPFNSIQRFGLIELQNKIPNRLEFDQLNELFSSYIKVAGMISAFLIISWMPAPVAFMILAATDVINNVFYWRAYKMYAKDDNTDSSSAT